MSPREKEKVASSQNDNDKTKQILRSLFQDIDTDQSGFIEYKELKSIMNGRSGGGTHQNEEEDDQNELDAAWISLLAIDENHDGKVSFPEFERAFRPLVERQLRRHNNKWLFWNRLQRKNTMQVITMDQLLQEWQGLADNLCMGSDLNLLLPPPPHATPIPAWRFAVTGIASGALGRIITAPLEKASLMQQVSGHSFRTEFRQAWKLAQSEGYLQTFWSGAGWNAFRVAIFSALSTTGTAQLYHVFPVPAFRDDDTEEATYDWREPAYRGTLGAMAGLVATIVTHPLDVIRTRVTLNDVHPSMRGSEALAESSNAIETVRIILSTGGTRALWRGLAPACLGVVPFCGAHHCLFDLFKHGAQQYLSSRERAMAYLSRKGGDDDGADDNFLSRYYGSSGGRASSLTVPVIVGCGVAAGMGAQTLVYPLEVIRRRQIEVGSGGTKFEYPMRTATRAILRDAGIPGLFAGLLPAYLRVAPAVVVSLMIRHHVVARLDGT